MIVEPVSISSNCPTCGKAIGCEVTDGDLTRFEDSNIVMSFITPSEADYS